MIRTIMALPLLLLLLFWTTTTTTDAKTVSGGFQLSGANTEHVLAKFALSAGATGAPFHVTFRSVDMYVDERNLRVRLYNDEDWHRYQYKSPTCQEKVRLARTSLPVVWNALKKGDEKTSDFYKTTSTGFKNKKEDQWEAQVKGTVQVEVKRNQYWYFVMDDCSLELYGHDEAAPPMTFVLQVWDAPPTPTLSGQLIQTHLPADEEGMSTLHWCSLVFSLLLALWLLLRTIVPALASSREAHVAPMVVVLASLANAASSAFELIHLRVYQQDGIGSYTCDALAAHCEALSDSLVALLLLCLGSGWTLPADVIRTGGGNSGNDGWLQASLGGLRTPHSASMFGLVLIGLHAGLAQWGRTFDDDFDCYHSLEHFPGRVLMMFRATLALVFLAGVAWVRQGGKCPPSLQKYLAKFALVGLAWFVSLPFVSIVVCSSLDFYQRHQALSMGAAAVQCLSLTSLTWLFGASSSSASAYHAISRAAAVTGGGGGGGGHNKGGDLTDLTAASASANMAATSNKSKNKSHSRVWTWGKTKIRLD